MIISSSHTSDQYAFEMLLQSCLASMNDEAKRMPSKIFKLQGRKLEPYVKETLDEKAKGTIFEGSIELIRRVY